MDEFVYTTDRTYTRVQLTNMELLLLKVLGYRMAPPTIKQFLSLFMSIQSVCATTENLALVSKNPLKCQPSYGFSFKLCSLTMFFNYVL